MLLFILDILKLFCKRPLTGLRLITFRRIINFFRLLITGEKNFDAHKSKYNSIFGQIKANDDIIPFERVPNRQDIIFFPMIDWGFRTQRPQHIARGLAKEYGRVFYLACNPLIADSNTAYSVDMVDGSFTTIMQVSNGTSRFPNFFTDQLTQGEINGYLASFQQVYSDFNITDATAVVQHPFWTPLVEALQFKCCLYDCIDLHSDFSGSDSHGLEKLENRLIRIADHIVVTSEHLQNRLNTLKKPQIIRNGCEFNRFSNIEHKENSTKITIGYVGSVSSWFDFDMVNFAANAQPNWTFNIYGAIEDGIVLWNIPKNVKFHREIPYEQVPFIMSSFDVAIIPFKIMPLTKAVNPVKIYEYAAAGKPVVSTALPEVEIIKGIDVLIAKTNEEFLECLKNSVLISNDIQRTMKLKKWAKGQDWSNRVNELINILSEKR